MQELSEELNAYIVLIPKVAMPHARPEDGALKTGFSIVTLKDPVCFGNKKNDPVYLVIGLSAVDNIIHLKTMKQLSRLLCDDDMVNNIIKSQSCEELYKYIEDFEKIAYMFSEIIDNKSKFTAKHSRNISNLAYEVSKYLNYPEEKCVKMRIAGLLHDIGKLAIPSRILDKNSSLSADEFSIIKSHVYYTKIILDRIEDIPDISEWASNHHEKLNGKGYPRALSSKDLSEESRIMAICDIYQALTEDRPYRKGLSNEKTFSIMYEMVNDNFICGKTVGYLKGAIGYVDKNEL